MIRQDRLETQLLAAIEQRILNPVMLDHVVQRCKEEFQKRVAEMECDGSITTPDSLKRERDEMKTRRSRLVQAIELGAGEISALTQRLHEVEDNIKRLDSAIEFKRPMKLEVALSEIRNYVKDSVRRLEETLKAGDISAAKAALAKHLGKLALTRISHIGKRSRVRHPTKAHGVLEVENRGYTSAMCICRRGSVAARIQ